MRADVQTATREDVMASHRAAKQHISLARLAAYLAPVLHAEELAASAFGGARLSSCNYVIAAGKGQSKEGGGEGGRE